MPGCFPQESTDRSGRPEWFLTILARLLPATKRRIRALGGAWPGANGGSFARKCGMLPLPHGRHAASDAPWPYPPSEQQFEKAINVEQVDLAVAVDIGALDVAARI